MDIIPAILQNYLHYQEPTLTNRFFKHAAIENLIHSKKKYLVTEARQIGSGPLHLPSKKRNWTRKDIFMVADAWR